MYVQDTIDAATADNATNTASATDTAFEATATAAYFIDTQIDTGMEALCFHIIRIWAVWR